MESLAPLRAIVWVQWRTSRNFFLRAHKGSLAVKWLMGLAWYGSWVMGALGAAFLASGQVPMAVVERALPGALFLIFFFWQLFPVILASQGAYLDMRRLLVYPIPDRQLFLLETALRVTTAIEMILVCGGLILGLLVNREVPLWGPAAIVVFMALNLLLATGVKSLLRRLFRKRGVRELMMAVLLGLVLVPQLFAAGIQDGGVPQLQVLRQFAPLFQALPWAAAGRLALGKFSVLPAAALAAWIGLAYAFARLQYARSLQLEEDSGGAARRPVKTETPWMDRAAGWPSAVMGDPAAALVEKDLRTLSRAPRFRLIFMMASTFGAVIWLPQVLRGGDGWLARNYMTLSTFYGMLVLGEVLYWNVFGFERASVQHWYATPVPLSAVLRAKNVVAGVFTFCSLTILGAITAVLPIGAGWEQSADAIPAAAVLLLCVMAGGNLTSVYLPRAVDAGETWRNTGSKAQFLMIFGYPFLCIPVALAQLTRWATGNYWSYHWVLAVAGVIAYCFYSAATETAIEVAERRKEQIVAALSHQDGPVSFNV